MPTYFCAGQPFPPDQFVDATTNQIAAQKAGRYGARGLEGDGESTFPIYLLEVVAPPQRWDVTATATVNRNVTVTLHGNGP